MSKQRANANEGRAIAAHPSLCVLLASAAFLLPAVAAPIASAEQPEPVALTETNPLSSQQQPAQSTTPFIMGRGDGAIITAIPMAIGSHRPIISDVNPNNQVDLYASANCSGAPVESGTVEELEGVGIQVEVAADSSTPFTAIQIDPTDPGSPSVCSKPIIYWHSSSVLPEDEEPDEPESPGPGGGTGPPSGGTTAPPTSAVPPAPRLNTVPSGRANNNRPLVTGSAPSAATVRIFSAPGCNGAVVAKGSVAELANGLPVPVPDNSVTIFTARSAAGGVESGCSQPVTYTEDSTAPRTRITMGPGVKTRRRKAVFRFGDTSGDPPGTTFVCKVDSKKWKPCHSPFKVTKLGFRSHVLRVRGTDLAGNVEARPVKRRFKVVRAP